MIYETNCLAHHGVKGMKWGVRKDTYGSSIKTDIKNKTQRITNKVKRKEEIKRILDKETRKLGSERSHDVRKLFSRSVSIGGIGGLVAAIAAGITTGSVAAMPVAALYGGMYSGVNAGVVGTFVINNKILKKAETLNDLYVEYDIPYDSQAVGNAATAYTSRK